jgi:hypothetical protein
MGAFQVFEKLYKIINCFLVVFLSNMLFWTHNFRFHKDNIISKVFSSKNCRDLTLVFTNTLRIVAKKQISHLGKFANQHSVTCFILQRSFYRCRCLKWTIKWTHRFVMELLQNPPSCSILQNLLDYLKRIYY